MMRFAVNMYDWAELYDGPNENSLLSPEWLLLSGIITLEIVACERLRPDGDSLLVEASVDQQRWAAIVEILRGKLGHHKNKRRLYQSKTGNGGWQRI